MKLRKSLVKPVTRQKTCNNELFGVRFFRPRSSCTTHLMLFSERPPNVSCGRTEQHVIIACFLPRHWLSDAYATGSRAEQPNNTLLPCTRTVSLMLVRQSFHNSGVAGGQWGQLPPPPPVENPELHCILHIVIAQFHGSRDTDTHCIIVIEPLTHSKQRLLFCTSFYLLFE